MHRSIIRPALVATFTTVGIALVAPLVAATPPDVTGQQCVAGGGYVMGDDPLPPGWCVGGKYDGQRIIDN
ncbi:hypothetical protein DZF91_29835 [Actinomadura logoneensis]|uniref:Uncharacterized protein n=1 Tax=Actinomadura logoneensis TaxID=2293572 RepID=A0A372JDE1_9ACTN|nr:hypothetical protein [Actinomadura logoneensis]RFU38025.1 hypothetical protein DZF91_29835 [Actinomadura logoneensis]